MVVAKRAYLPYPVTPEWCGRVRDALTTKGRGSQSRLAEFLKVSTSKLAETLDGKYQTSDLVEPIHKFFGWEAPLPPTASLDAGEIIHTTARLTQAQRDLIEEAIAIVDGKSGEQARRALQEMIKAFRLQPKND